MNLLVLNGGSSSIKFSIFASTVDGSEPSLLLDGELSRISTAEAALVIVQGKQAQEQRAIQASDTPAGMISVVFDAIRSADAGEIDAVGYRVVHPGAEIWDHVRITDEILKKLEAAASFAPLHDPEAVEIIRETMRRMPDVPHFACFDTVFHQTMPEEGFTYAIPTMYRERGVRRYGFHGLSCESVVRQMRNLGLLPRRMVIAHLGSGCSVTAVVDGESVDTTMGLTPTGGVVMGTRPGDLDPGLLLYLLRQQEGTDGPDRLEKMLNHDAGMVALTGLPNDMKAVRKAAKEGNAQATLALKVFTRGIRKTIGGFAWLMGGLDAIVFTGGIGEHDAATRVEVLSGSGVSINSSLNEAKSDGVRRVSASDSKTAVFAVPAQEDLVIALHVKRMVQADA
ncbi:MAG TPA: acetate/propionate family kinase [Edaphobacter sp.]|uniref:acetate/propionate family kinase n=1 Tax=Edaphobacter sp. TaxID=1934404 RepID=UPI002C1DAB32|nr:acetate/propionate family kinase [Edaphobacter sp.]HUZ96323.1 acetate/propionate family kinase [Edaphobacter sp.]